MIDGTMRPLIDWHSRTGSESKTAALPYTVCFLYSLLPLIEVDPLLTHLAHNHVLQSSDRLFATIYVERTVRAMRKRRESNSTSSSVKRQFF